MALESGVAFVPIDQVRSAVDAAGVPPAEADALVAAYGQAQLQGLRIGLLLAGLIVVGAMFLTSGLPDRPMLAAAAGGAGPGPSAARVGG